MSDYKGENILEVWDYRLSVAVPIIKRGKTWEVKIFAKDNPDYDPEDPGSVALPLESHDTGILVEKGDHYDAKKVAKCYEWLRSVRDKYARDDIEKLKPLVAKINAAQAAMSEALAGKAGGANVAQLIVPVSKIEEEAE